MNKVYVGILQFRPVLLKKEENIEKIISFIEGESPDLVIMPELAISGYFFRTKKEVERMSERIPDGKFFNVFKELSKRKKTSYVIGFPEKYRGNFYNSALYITPRGYGVYRKVHLFYEEKKFFKPGKSLESIFRIKNFKIGVLICFDWIFPEASRALALRGVHAIVHPSNLVLPGLAQLGMRVRAIENRIFTITANRVGIEKRGKKKYKFTGKSQVVNPKGEIILSLGENEEKLKICEVDLKLAEDKFITPLNHVFKDRRKKIYPV